MLKRHLAEAEEHIAVGEKNLARQRELIAKLERDKHDTAQARALLDQFEELQSMHLADRERILRELSESPNSEAGLPASRSAQWATDLRRRNRLISLILKRASASRPSGGS
jgi:hypothetical protein